MSMAVVGMEEQHVNEVGENKAEKGEDRAEESGEMVGLSRKEKRKTLKKMKRKQIRKELAEKEKEEEDARLNDPEEQARLKAAEEEEARRRERELKEFEERERAWMEAMELKKKLEEERAEEEKQRRDLEESEKKQQVDEENKCIEDDEWEYVEEGPPEVIFQGNEIILRKKKVRIRKKQVDEQGVKDDANRLTSNPLPPESESFADYGTASSASQVLENVAQQVPNFGTEQDKAHCPFHLKTGACRFGQRCSRVHFYPGKSNTLLMKNMYTGPGPAWEQDEGLEYTDEEVDHCYEEFYDDVHTEFMKFGEIINFKVCKNGSFHLRGNVYVHYKSLESAVLAYESINGRYFGGKQVNCEFVNVTKWKIAICGEYMKSRFRACSRGTACNFIHCFRNPGGDYEWADWDKPPPRYWMKRMASLFGYFDEHEKQTEHEHVGNLKDLKMVISRDSHREPFRRSSRSRDAYRSDNRSGQSYVNLRNHSNDRERISEQRDSRYEGSYRSRTRTYSGECYSDGGMEEDGESVHEGSYPANKTAERQSKWEISSPDHGVVRKRIRLNYSDDERTMSTDYGRKGSEDPKRRSSRNHDRERSPADQVGMERSNDDLNQEMSNRDRDKHRYHQQKRKGSERHEKITQSAENHKKESHDVGSITDMDDNVHHCHRKKDSGDHEKSSGTPDLISKSKKGKCHDGDLKQYCLDEDGDKSRLHYHNNSGCNDKIIDKGSRNFDQMNHDADCHRSHRRKEVVSEESTDDGGRYLKLKHYDTDSSEGRSERKRQRRRHHSQKRKHSRNHRKYSESPENRTVHCMDSREASLDRERETSNQESAGFKRHRQRDKWQYDDHDDDELPKSDGNVDGLDRWKP